MVTRMGKKPENYLKKIAPSMPEDVTPSEARKFPESARNSLKIIVNIYADISMGDLDAGTYETFFGRLNLGEKSTGVFTVVVKENERYIVDHTNAVVKKLWYPEPLGIEDPDRECRIMKEVADRIAFPESYADLVNLKGLRNHVPLYPSDRAQLSSTKLQRFFDKKQYPFEANALGNYVVVAYDDRQAFAVYPAIKLVGKLEPVVEGNAERFEECGMHINQIGEYLRKVLLSTGQ